MSATFDLSKVAGGALQRKVNQAFAQVVENMCDPNTVPDKKREINIKVQFVQDSYGGQCNCQVSGSTKLAQALPVKTMFLTDRISKPVKYMQMNMEPRYRGSRALKM